MSLKDKDDFDDLQGTEFVIAFVHPRQHASFVVKGPKRDVNDRIRQELRGIPAMLVVNSYWMAVDGSKSRYTSAPSFENVAARLDSQKSRQNRRRREWILRVPGPDKVGTYIDIATYNKIPSSFPVALNKHLGTKEMGKILSFLTGGMIPNLSGIFSIPPFV